jgi:peptidoglycan/LPS O-acetylase OafA/YrhL
MFKTLFRPLNLDLRSNSFDFVRLTLALAVVISHSIPLGNFKLKELSFPIQAFSPDINSITTVGHLAVFGFFAISGFLITASWLNTNSIEVFLKNRFLRIFPAFWICLAITAFLFSPIIYYSFGTENYFFIFAKRSLGYVWYNWSTFMLQTGIFDPKDLIHKPLFDLNGSLWTLTYELRMYFFVVVLGILGVLKKPKTFTLITTFLVLVYPLIMLNSEIFKIFKIFSEDTYALPMTAYFFAGAWLYIFKGKIKWNYPVFLVSIIGIIIGINFNLLSIFGPICLSYFILFLCFALPIKNIAKKIGDWSYGVYIYGWPIQLTLGSYKIFSDNLTAFVLASVSLSLLCGYLSWNLIEKPILLRFKKTKA